MTRADDYAGLAADLRGLARFGPHDCLVLSANALDRLAAVEAVLSTIPCPAGCDEGRIIVSDGDYEGAGCHEEDCSACGGSGHPSLTAALEMLR